MAGTVNNKKSLEIVLNKEPDELRQPLTELVISLYNSGLYNSRKAGGVEITYLSYENVLSFLKRVDEFKEMGLINLQSSYLKGNYPEFKRINGINYGYMIDNRNWSVSNNTPWVELMVLNVKGLRESGYNIDITRSDGRTLVIANSSLKLKGNLEELLKESYIKLKENQ